MATRMVTCLGAKQWLICAACEHDVLRETAGLSALSSYKSSTLVLTQKEVADKRRAERMTEESLSLSPALSLCNTSVLQLPYGAQVWQHWQFYCHTISSVSSPRIFRSLLLAPSFSLFSVLGSLLQLSTRYFKPIFVIVFYLTPRSMRTNY